MIQIGKYNTLPVLGLIQAGLRLGTEDDWVLLPRRVAPDVVVGDVVKVFVYTDSEDRPIATTDEPKALVGEFAQLEVVDVSRHGAFLDWGLPKDLIVPTREQHKPLRVGDKVVVYVALDREDRVMAGAKLARFFDKRVEHLHVGQQVDILVYGHSDRGIRVVVDGRHSGMLFQDQTFKKLEEGQRGRAWIENIRPDGRLDLSIRPPGKSTTDDALSLLVAALKANNGFLPIHDKSPPETIRQHVAVSKKAFKKAVGSLYKARRLTISDSGIQWIGGEL